MRTSIVSAAPHCQCCLCAGLHWLRSQACNPSFHPWRCCTQAHNQPSYRAAARVQLQSESRIGRRVPQLVCKSAGVSGPCAKSKLSSANNKSESKIRNREFVRESSDENPEFRIARRSGQVSSLTVRIQSSEFASGHCGQEKQAELRVESCDPSLMEFEVERVRIQSSESTVACKGENHREEFKVQSLERL